jgi:hypothetical protein
MSGGSDPEHFPAGTAAPGAAGVDAPPADPDGPADAADFAAGPPAAGDEAAPAAVPAAFPAADFEAEAPPELDPAPYDPTPEDEAPLAEPAPVAAAPPVDDSAPSAPETAPASLPVAADASPGSAPAAVPVWEAFCWSSAFSSASDVLVPHPAETSDRAARMPTAAFLNVRRRVPAPSVVVMSESPLSGVW